MPGRGICPRCGHQDRWMPRFSEHLGECTVPFSVEHVYSMLDVVPLSDTECWEIPEMRSVPKIGVAPKKVEYAYVIVAIAMYGDRRGSLMVCHRCDNRACLNPGHLYWGTSSDNGRDAWRNGRRVMSPEQQLAMQTARTASPRNKARMAEHNRALAERNRGSDHWTRSSDEEMSRWKNAMRAGRERARR
jgi:hypothetical protein